MDEETKERFNETDRRLDGMERRLDGMDHRLEGMDLRLRTVEQSLAVVLSNYATKTDLEALEKRLIKWFTATAAAITLGVGSIAVLTVRLLC